MLLLVGCEEPPQIQKYMAPRNPEARPFSMTVPESWRLAPNDRFSNLALEVGDSETGVARVTVSQLARSGDEFLLANVNRWRGQVGLEPTTALEDLIPIQITNSVGRLLALDGSKKSMVTGIVEHHGSSWIFKLSGTPSVVARYSAEFESFMKSIEFFDTPAGDQ